MKEKFKLLKKILGIFFGVIVALLICVTVIVSVTNKKNNKPTFIFGYSLLWVVTGSMEPQIPARSYILTKYYDGGDIEEGEVITFICKDPSSEAYGSLITHRVEAVTAEGLKTKGDNNPAADSFIVQKEDVVAVSFVSLPVATVFGRIFSSGAGLALIAILFVGSCVFIYIPDIIGTLKSEDKAKNNKEEEIARRVALEVERMRKEDAEKGE